MASTQTDFLQRREQQIFWAILIAHTALALSFSLGPIFEGPDEIEHYRYVRTLAQTGALPDPYAQIRGEYHQPPLLYLALVPFTWLADGSDFDQIDGRLNPHYPYLVQVPGGDNKNKFIHTRAEAFPYTGSSTARAVHLMRLLSVAAGAGTVLASRAVFRLLWPENAALRLLATGIVAFWPQFIYMSSVISNDSILIFISTLALFLLLWAQHHDPSWRWAAALGVTLGAALLTKISAGLLALPVAAFFVFANRKWRYVLPVGAVTGLAAGWWYIHNWLRYGDPLGTKAAAHTWAFEVIRPGEFALDIALR
ncbi:MAG: phospholipid carrier-dependent glycosyltransferase, partial [Anaerolineae bacterium]|nr:phospholipid carrier-dependent glycosyltransferase [Anaerolineae bacterium]